jgi:hypothetical protein
MHEGPLDAAIKAFLVRPGDRLEVPVVRFVIDLTDGESDRTDYGHGALESGRKRE